jgi:hypothetical protein
VQEAQVQMHTPGDVYDMLCVWQVQVQEAQVQMHTANTQGQADPYISLRQQSFAIFNQMVGIFIMEYRTRRWCLKFFLYNKLVLYCRHGTLKD